MMEVKNPTMLFEGDFGQDMSGVSIFAATQGTRPMLLEIQALCAHTQLNIPRRLCSGIDQNRLYMVCAVLEKKIGLKLYQQDIFVNVAGGIKVREHAADLAMAVSIVSSLRNLGVPRDTAFIGEVGLSGEIRHVAQLSAGSGMCQDGDRPGICAQKQHRKGADYKIRVEGVSTLSDVLAKVFF